MALSSYLKLTGKNQGEIKGPVTLFGREKSIEIFSWDYELIQPRDPGSGTPTGRRQHKAIVITKTIDKTTPLLLRALINDELIASWRLECWRPASDGSQQPYYRIDLKNAVIAGIAAEQLNNQRPENAALPIQEQVSFIYQKITWTWLEGDVSAEDDLARA